MKGFDKLQRKLRDLPRRGAKTAMRKATRAGTTVLLRAVRSGTPKDEGFLRRAQASKITGRGTFMAGIVGADVDKLKAAEAGGTRPSNIDHLVEFGHTAPDGKFIPPSGYMRRAADTAMPAAESAYRNKLAIEIEREAMKA